MSKELHNAILLAAISAAGLLFVRVLPQLAIFIGITVLIFHTSGLMVYTKKARKSSLRPLLFTQSIWLLISTIGVLYFVESATLHFIVIFLSGFILLLHDYHGLHFMLVPAKRAQLVLLNTSWVTQAYTMFLTLFSVFGLVVFVQLKLIWVLILVGLVTATQIYALLCFVEKRKAYQLASTLVLLISMIEISWVLLFLPFGHAITALIGTILYIGFLMILNAVKNYKLYGILAGIIILVLILARWL